MTQSSSRLAYLFNNFCFLVYIFIQLFPPPEDSEQFPNQVHSQLPSIILPHRAFQNNSLGGKVPPNYFPVKLRLYYKLSLFIRRWPWKMQPQQLTPNSFNISQKVKQECPGERIVRPRKYVVCVVSSDNIVLHSMLVWNLSRCFCFRLIVIK